METHLDHLLDVAREDRTDALFVARVMTQVRADVERRRRAVGWVTGPAAIAAAAVIALGAGVATLVRSTGSGDSALRATQAAPRTAQQVHVDRPGRSTSPASTTRDETAGPTATYGDGGLEWGYAADKSAYALDRATGLRLETRVDRTRFDAGVPQPVSLSLVNTGRGALVVSAAKHCTLVVAAYPVDGSAAAEHTDATPQQCATTDGGRPSTTSETFVLKPGARRVAEATVVLATSGDWNVVGMCECSYGPAGRASPTPEDDPLGELGRLTELGAYLPQVTQPQRSAEQSKRLVTPPIKVTAS